MLWNGGTRIMMRENIISYCELEVKKRCESENNFFGMGCYYHIKAVVKNAVFLAEKYEADIEVVTIAAWLHDVASVTDYKYYEEHHIWGAKMAEEILTSFQYEYEKIDMIKNCILNHRGSKLMDKQTAEEKCVADADAISHFDSIPSLFHLAYVNRKLDIQTGIEFVRNKLERSYNKLSDDSKTMYQSKYHNVMDMLQ